MTSAPATRQATEPILPGATLGVLGSGQLGRMFAIAARRMGYRVHALSPDDDTPTGQVADVEIRADYDDLDAVRRFAQGVAALTFEFENVHADATHVAEEVTVVRPAGRVLHTTQHRLREKAFLREHGFPTAPFDVVATLDDLPLALDRIGLPAVLKTTAWGYDGKGQQVIRHHQDAAAAWQAVGGGPCVLEGFIDFEAELSVVGARSLTGSFEAYGPIFNTHVRHILDLSIYPAGLPEELGRDARAMAQEIMQQLDVVGVLCVEYFLTRDGRLLVNELAPRPHNSGHLTIDACVTCQFEQQVRTITGLPMGSPRQLRPAAMANLLGDLWQAGEPDWAAACAGPDVKLHLYGKRQPRPGRKMGHLTALADSAEDAARLAREARERLTAKYAS